MARLEVTPVRLALRAPVRSSWGELRERDLLRVRLAWADDDFGVGEAAPLEPYDGVPLAAVAAALQVYESVLAAADRDAGHAELLAACAQERDLPQALAAIDLALWDRAGRRAGRPVAHLFAAGAATAVAVNATIGAEDRAGAAAQAAAAARAGFGCVKVKVGIGDDAGRVAAVRAAVGPETAIRVDANGAWSSAGEALANLRALAPAGLEYAEEPVHGVDALRAVRAASPVPVAMDETAAEPGAAGVRRGGRGLPEDRALRRDHGAAARRARGARGRQRGLRRVDVRRAARRGGRGARRGGARGDRARSRPAGWRRSRCSRAWRACWRRCGARSPCRPAPACSG